MSIVRVISFLSRAEALAAMEQNQARLNARISPDYTTQQRVQILTTFDGDHAYSLALVPSGLTVNIGDSVEVEAHHRDPHYPCHYVPSMIRRLVKRAS